MLQIINKGVQEKIQESSTKNHLPLAAEPGHREQRNMELLKNRITSTWCSFKQPPCNSIKVSRIATTEGFQGLNVLTFLVLLKTKKKRKIKLLRTPT